MMNQAISFLLIALVAFATSADARKLLGPKDKPAPANTIAGVLQRTGSLSVAAQLMAEAGLTEQLASKTLFATAFIPSDAAFAAFFEANPALSAEDKKQLLLDHVVNGKKIMSGEMPLSSVYATMLGNTIRVIKDARKRNTVYTVRAAFNSATITVRDLNAGRCVVHVINAVLDNTPEPVEPEQPTTRPVDPEQPTTRPVDPEQPTTGPVDPEQPTTGPVDPEQPTTGPVDESTEQPTTGPVDESTEQPTTGPVDEATDAPTEVPAGIAGGVTVVTTKPVKVTEKPGKVPEKPKGNGNTGNTGNGGNGGNTGNGGNGGGKKPKL